MPDPTPINFGAVPDLGAVAAMGAQQAAMEAGKIPRPKNWDELSWAERAEVHARVGIEHAVRASQLANVLEHATQPNQMDIMRFNLFTSISQMNAALGQLCERINQRPPEISDGNVTLIPGTGRLTAIDPREQ